ncbi:MAG: hypothetical protein HRU29_05395 [Rhizobiales bacterium]|nr:hypothetical protein [Hyphomicrobiales bacterium]NRB13818.1 hypothetical protein [Hyphomicrobiales bacterium]
MDTTSLFYYFGVLAVLVAAIWALVFFIKKFTQNKGRVSARSNDIFNSKTSSLFVQEVLPIDQKTKIIIVGRDNLRHVILLGETHSNLIETVTPNALNNAEHSTAVQTESEQPNTPTTAAKLAFKPTNDAQLGTRGTSASQTAEPTPNFNSLVANLAAKPEIATAELAPKSEPVLTANVAPKTQAKPKAAAKTEAGVKADIKPKSEPKASSTGLNSTSADAPAKKATADKTLADKTEPKKPAPEPINIDSATIKINLVETATIETTTKGIVSKLQAAKNLSDTAKD